MVDKSLVQRKLTLLQNKKGELEGYGISSLRDFRKKTYMQKAVEKMLQEMVEICVDVAKHIIADESLRIPDDAKDAFTVLHEKGILSSKCEKILQKMVGFRNLIVHLYERVDVEIVYGIYKNHLGDFDFFSKEILEFLRR